MILAISILFSVTAFASPAPVEIPEEDPANPTDTMPAEEALPTDPVEEEPAAEEPTVSDGKEPAASAQAEPAAPAEPEGIALTNPLGIITANVTDVGSLPPSEHATLTSVAPQDSAGSIYIGHEVTGKEALTLDDTVIGPAYTAVYAAGADADAGVTGTLVIADGTSGGQASDRTGRGAALVAHDGARLTVDSADVGTDGFARAALVVSEGASATVKDSRFIVLGADPLTEADADPASDPKQLSPAWTLGVTGGARAVNMVGQNPCLALVGSDVTAAGWGALSTDAGADASALVLDSALRILPAAQDGMDAGADILGYDAGLYGSGFGAYLSGNAALQLLGATVTGATYGVVLDDADAVRLSSSDGGVLLYDGEGKLAESVQGQGQSTSVQSVFGFLMTGDADVTVEDGSSLQTEEATVLYKDGSGSFCFDGAELCSSSGVLFQMMDDDSDPDPITAPGFPGIGAAQPEEEPASGARAVFTDTLAETSKSEPDQVSVTYKNGVYRGNIYNGTGYYGQAGDSLTVTLGQDTLLNGDISLTSSVKAIPYSREALAGINARNGAVEYVFLDASGTVCGEEDAVTIQLVRYTANEYFLQGHVQNMPLYNGASELQVVVEDGGVWVINEQAILTGLTVREGGAVYGQVQEREDGSLLVTPASVPLAPGEYGPAEAPADSASAIPEDAAPEAANAPEDVLSSAADGMVQQAITINGQPYTLDLYIAGGKGYAKLTELAALLRQACGEGVS